MASVAAVAGVSRQAVYLHFPGRMELLVALVDDLNGPIGDRFREVSEAPSGRDALHSFVEIAVWQTHQYGPLLRAVRDAIANDPALAKLWSKRRSGRSTIALRVVEHLRRDRLLHPDLDVTNAKGALVALTGPEVVAGLLGSMDEDTAAATLLRSISGALLQNPVMAR